MPAENLNPVMPPLPDPLPPFHPEPPTSDELLPPFPPITPRPWPPFLPIRSLRCGCYLINYKPTGAPLWITYDGTLRVECHEDGRTASGDLYSRPFIFLPPLPLPPPPFPPGPILPPIPILLPGPNPASGIPILSRGRYRKYLRVTQILEHFTFGNSFTLGFEMYRFTAPNTWTNEGAFTARMSWTPAPTGYPSSSNYLEGEVKNAGGTIVGRLTMGWVSKYLRKATVEIDRVSASEAPLDNGTGLDWENVFEQFGWDVTVDNSNADVAEPSGAGWSNAEMHAAMLARRAAVTLDTEWRYHVLAVRELDATSRGIMYDNGATDSNNVPREGIGISSHWVIPNASPWGTVKGMRFGTAAAPYFRTAIHEVGHAMGLYHNTVDNGFMNTTDVIANSCPTTFPACIQWSFADDDENRLRHYPDVHVRPGGTAFGQASNTTPPISPADMIAETTGLELKVTPVLEAVPLGAPVRVNLLLVNASPEPRPAPGTLSMLGGMVRGTVVDPSGTMRTFLPLVRCVEEHPIAMLQPGESLIHSLTLLRGAEGALFPTPGVYRIIVEAHFEANGAEAAVIGETNVIVTSIENDAHAKAALKVLSTPDALLTLVLGGDHLPEGIDAIQTALQNPVLKPHFAFVEAKRLAERFGKRKANLKAAAELIDDATVMSPAEIKRAAKLVKAEGADTVAGKSIAKTLKSKVRKQKVSEDVKDAVDSL
ncbi:MAG: hypothetical protein ACT4QE_16535 [Anaerolineales bacterium]